MCVRAKYFLKGKPLKLYYNGNLLTENLAKAEISKSDVVFCLQLYKVFLLQYKTTRLKKQ